MVGQVAGRRGKKIGGRKSYLYFLPQKIWCGFFGELLSKECNLHQSDNYMWLNPHREGHEQLLLSRQ